MHILHAWTGLRTRMGGITLQIGTWMRRRLESRRLPLYLALLSTALCFPGVRLGYQADDHLHRAVLSGEQEFAFLGRSAWSLFTFMDGDPVKNQQAIADGNLPWWTTPTIRAALFRPLTGWTHWVDMRLWPNQPVPAHVHSLLWHGVMIALATSLFQRVVPIPWVGGLAALLYAVDDARGVPAMWIANRNAITTMTFVLLTLICHHARRSEGSIVAGRLGPVCFALALCAGEGGVTAGGYLLAYALFMEHGPWRPRIAMLLPYLAVGTAWLVMYRALGFGVSGLGAYIDPVGEPLRFLAALPERASLLLCGMFAVPPAEIGAIVSRRLFPLAFSWAAAVLTILAYLLWPVVKREPVARFFALGSVLGALPVCATFPGDRLLTFAGWGGAGLMAMLTAQRTQHRDAGEGHSIRGTLRRRVLIVLGIVHLVLAPVNLTQASRGIKAFGEAINTSAQSLPAPGREDERLIVASTPSAFLTVQAGVARATFGLPWHRRSLVLSSTIFTTELERVDERTIRVRPQGGYLMTQGQTPRDSGTDQPLVDLRYIFGVFDRLFRAPQPPFREGEHVELQGIMIVIRTLTADGRPAEVDVVFDRPADDPSLRWVTWKNGVYAPLTPPTEGATITLPPNRVPFRLW